jgi:DNA-directed RNA polymerase specialized sigma24 family protein
LEQHRSGQYGEREDNRLELALQRSIQGDSTAFVELVRAHQGMVFSIACHYLQDRSLAEDLAQEVFLELYQGLDRIQSAAHLTFWLRRVTAHRCIDQGRRKLRRRELRWKRRRNPPPPMLPLTRCCCSDCSIAWLCCRRSSAWW